MEVVAVEAVAVEAVAVEAVAVEAVAVEAVAAEAVAVEAVAVEAVVAEAVAAEAVETVQEIPKVVIQTMVVAQKSHTVAKHVVKITNLAIRLVRVTKADVLKAEGITGVEVTVAKIGEEVVTETDHSSSSTFFVLIGEKIPLSSTISLAPGRTARISSVISPVFL